MEWQETVRYPFRPAKRGQDVFARSSRRRAVKLLKHAGYHALLIPPAILMGFPFLWMISASLKKGSEVFSRSLSLIPETPQWHNYAAAWNSAPFDVFFLNSFLMAAGIVIGQVITCTLAAYGFSQVDFKGKKLLFLIVLSSMMIPAEATIIPAYLIIKELNWLNSYYGLIVPGMTSVFGIFLMRQFFLTLPRDYFEAAKLEGASHYSMYATIALPLAKPAIATLCIFAFLNVYNSYMWPLLITTDVNMRTLQIGLRYLIDSELGTRWPELMAASTFVILPVLLVFVFFQRYFIKGVVGAGVTAKHQEPGGRCLRSGRGVLAESGQPQRADRRQQPGDFQIGCEDGAGFLGVCQVHDQCGKQRPKKHGNRLYPGPTTFISAGFLHPACGRESGFQGFHGPNGLFERPIRQPGRRGDLARH